MAAGAGAAVGASVEPRCQTQGLKLFPIDLSMRISKSAPSCRHLIIKSILSIGGRTYTPQLLAMRVECLYCPFI
jgi:hypothetical protein